METEIVLVDLYRLKATAGADVDVVAIAEKAFGLRTADGFAARRAF